MPISSPLRHAMSGGKMTGMGCVRTVWHAPAPYDLAVRVPVLHALEHASLLGTAVLFWWALLHRPKAHAHLGAAAVYVFTTALHTGLLGVLLLLARAAVQGDTREKQRNAA